MNFPYSQLRKVWTCWVSCCCKKPYAHLPRYQIYRNSHRRKSCCRFFQEFYCTVDSLIALTILASIVAFSVLFLTGTTVTDILYKIGWISFVPISISSLDCVEDINFPGTDQEQGKASSAYHHEYHHHLAKKYQSVVWRVEGFSQYNELLRTPGVALGVFARLTPGKKWEDMGNGYWFFAFGPTVTRSSSIGSISALKISEHSSIAPEEIEVAISIRAFVEGDAALVVKYEDTLSNHVFSQAIDPELFKNKGFCYTILNVPFNKRIETIHIRPVSTNLRREGIVIVDQIHVVVGKRGVTESFMHTLVPNNWC